MAHVLQVFESMASVGEGVGVGWSNGNAEETLSVVACMPCMTNTKKHVAIGLESGLAVWVGRVLVCLPFTVPVCLYMHRRTCACKRGDRKGVATGDDDT